MRGVFDNFGPKTFLQLLFCSYFIQNVNILFVDPHKNSWPLYRVRIFCMLQFLHYTGRWYHGFVISLCHQFSLI